MGVLAVVISIIVTRKSPGFYPDSSVYLGTARNLLDGRGLTTPFDLIFNPYPPAQAAAFHGRVPLTQYPPLYPILLAGLGKLGWGLVDAARFVDALLFGVNVVLAGLLMLRITRSGVVAVVSALGLVLTVNLVVNHGLLMSEPVMIAIVLGGLLLMPRVLRAPTPAAVVAVGVCAGAASLTRLAGVSFTIAAVVAVLLWTRRPFGGRVRVAAALAAMGLGPLALWMIITRVVSPAADIRPVRFHLPAWDQYETFVDVVSSWLVGAGGNRTVHLALLGALVVVLALLGVVVTRSRLRSHPVADEGDAREPDADDPDDPEPAWLLGLLALFVVAYLATVFVTAVFLDATTSPEGRLLVPVQIAGALLVLGLVHRATLTVSGDSIAAVALTVVVVVLCAWPWRSIANGYGTTSTVDVVQDGFPAQAKSPLGEAVARLPAGALIATTFPASLYASSGRDNIFAPPRRSLIAGEDNPDFAAQLRELGRVLAARHGYLVLYPDLTTALPSAKDFRRAMHLVRVGTYADGVIYRVEPPT
ncbi:MAG: hypothetical protein QOE08_2133 [Thermoleophilaceae bacterium]|nr:hypothetical protein [Thermoleophilaceae bacterium]